jgi:hypothetical protein
VPETRIQVRKIKLHLRGIDPATAREVARGLGEAIATGLGPQLATTARGGEYGRLDLGSVRVRASGAASIQATAADAVRGALVQRLESRQEGQR